MFVKFIAFKGCDIEPPLRNFYPPTTVKLFVIFLLSLLISQLTFFVSFLYYFLIFCVPSSLVLSSPLHSTSREDACKGKNSIRTKLFFNVYVVNLKKESLPARLYLLSWQQFHILLKKRWGISSGHAARH